MNHLVPITLKLSPSLRAVAFREAEVFAENLHLGQKTPLLVERERPDELLVKLHAQGNKGREYPELSIPRKSRVALRLLSPDLGMDRPDMGFHRLHLRARGESHGVNGLKRALESAERVLAEVAMLRHAECDLRMGVLENRGRGTADEQDVFAVYPPNNTFRIEKAFVLCAHREKHHGMSSVIDTLICPKISLSSAGPSWDSLSDFDSALEMPLHYLRGPQDQFKPASVRLGWNNGHLLVLATMQDIDVYTRVTADNQDLWDLGDVFEIFMRDSATEEYFELHTSPTGHRLQLKFQSAQNILDLRDGVDKLENFVMTEDILFSQVRTTTEGWQALCVVKWPYPDMAGRAATISLSRYDYTQGQEEPVLSSTSLHQVVNYHRQEEWTPIVFGA